MRRDIICVLGSFVVDLTSCAEHLPVLGETVIGSSFSMGPVGKDQIKPLLQRGQEVM